MRQAPGAGLVSRQQRLQQLENGSQEFTRKYIAGSPRHKGSTGQWGLALPWVNRYKSRFLEIPPHRFIYISRIGNLLLQMEPAQLQRWCLQTREGISRPYTESSSRLSVKPRRRYFPHIGQPTMQLTGSAGIPCPMPGFNPIAVRVEDIKSLH